MPRIPQSVVLRAYKKHPLLYLVLQGARTLESASNELRWLQEHNQSLKPLPPHRSRDRLFRLCQRRSRAEPLQYILGTQPFGELDIKCRRGVLIPRPETEAYTTYLAKLLCKHELHPDLAEKFNGPKTNPQKTLKILDLCSGSGCISLLLHNILSTTFPHLRIWGLDISPTANHLAVENLHRNVKAGHLLQAASEDTLSHVPQVQFGSTNVLKNLPQGTGDIDIIISNPPYVSEHQYRSETTRSAFILQSPLLNSKKRIANPFMIKVRNWEPRSALVANDPSADIFYHRLITHHRNVNSKVLLMEVGDAAQAVRVAEHAASSTDPPDRIEIWRDDPAQETSLPAVVRELDGSEIRFRGQGKIRAVVLFRADQKKEKEEIAEYWTTDRLPKLRGKDYGDVAWRAIRGDEGKVQAPREVRKVFQNVTWPTSMEGKIATDKRIIEKEIAGRSRSGGLWSRAERLIERKKVRVSIRGE